MAHNNPRYTRIRKNTIGVAFLGTPHRGADLEKLLKAILDVSFTERKSVRDLVTGSNTIKETNDAFLEHAQSLQLASFSESTGMSIVEVCISLLLHN